MICSYATEKRRASGLSGLGGSTARRGRRHAEGSDGAAEGAEGHAAADAPGLKLEFHAYPWFTSYNLV